MSSYTADRQRSTEQQTTVAVSGGTLVYDVERETTATGSRIVGWTLAGVTDTTDRDALADALAELGHARRRAFEPEVQR